MTESARPRWWTRTSLRLRLTALFTLATTVVVIVGAIALSLILRHGLQDNLDSSLQARADQVDAAALLADTPASTTRSGRGRESLTQLYSPTGTLAYSSSPDVSAVISPADISRADDLGRTRSISVDDDRLRVLWTLRTTSSGRFVVLVGTDLGATEDDAADIDGVLLWTAPIMILIAAGATWLLAGAALRPVERMRVEAAAISSTDSDRRLTVPPSKDELATLGGTLNEMLDRLHEAIRRQREFVADAGHELRTPLAVLRTELELASGPSRTEADLRDSVAHAVTEVDRLSALASSLLDLARADTLVASDSHPPINVAPVLDAAVRSARAAADTKSVELIADYAPEFRAAVDPAGLRQVSDNILTNAIQHTPSGGTVVVTVRSSGGWTEITFRDSGPGMPAEFIDHAFERFRRADEARTTGPDGLHRAGLGLAIVHAIVHANGGTVVAENQPEGGLAVRVRLPDA